MKWSKLAPALLLFALPAIFLTCKKKTETAGFGLDARPTLPAFSFPADQPSPGAMTYARVFPNLLFQSPLFLTYAPDGTNRIFVVTQVGGIYVFPNNNSQTTTKTFLNVSSLISSGAGEEGLLGLAFDPHYAQNGYFYINYTAPAPLRTVVARYRVSTTDPDLADPASATVLLTVNQPFTNHNGGMLAFGPDNYLYVGLGDGGSAGDPSNNGQNTNALLGKILRIDPSGGTPYAIPPDNPLVGQTGVKTEIYAYGARNPFRFSFDRATGDLWVGDVGQDQYEEIDLVKKGDNLGWNVCEGQHRYNAAGTCPTTYRAPVIEYPHAQGICVIGGYVYRGTAIPSLRGTYVYGDYGSNKVWGLVYDGQNVVSNTLLTTLTGNVSSFGEDQNGELYITNADEKIYQLRTATPGGATFPLKLSDTGLFKNLATLTAVDGLVEYDVNVPFWSDGATKRRWIGVPNNSQITFSATSPWTFPVGTVVVKHFDLALSPTVTRRLETRVLINQAAGWTGVTYRWNAAGTDADLLTTGFSENFTVVDGAGSRTQTYTYPSPTDCLRCHNAAAGSVLGINTRQMNRDFVYPKVSDNQLRAWNHVGLFTTDIGEATKYEAYPLLADATKAVSLRARAYLAVNCAQCHQPNGGTSVNLDLRYDTARTAMNIIGVAPVDGNLGLSAPFRVAPGAKENSVLWLRPQRTDSLRMPPIGSNVVDASGVTLLGSWIDAGAN